MLAPNVTRAEVAARIRAAIGYSGKELDDLYSELGKGFSPATLRRMYLDTRKDFKAASIDELHAIADACGVPHAFMHEGFSRFVSDAVLAARVEDIDRRLAIIEGRTEPLAETPYSDLLDDLRELQKRAAEDAQKPAPPRRSATGHPKKDG